MIGRWGPRFVARIPAWPDIGVTVSMVRAEVPATPEDVVSASHPTKRRSPKRFFISPLGARPLPAPRYVTQMEEHGRNIFIPFRRRARAASSWQLRLSCPLPPRRPSGNLYFIELKAPTGRPSGFPLCAIASALLRSLPRTRLSHRCSI